MKIIMIFAISFLMLFQCCVESTNTEQQKNTEFKNFLNRFTLAELPINYKRSLFEMATNQGKLNEIDFEDAKFYLGFLEKELYNHRLVYDYETFEESYIREINLPAAHLRFTAPKFIGIIYRYGRGMDSDSVSVHLRIFDFNGKFIDELSFFEQTTRENDWTSFVILSENNLKIFKYSLNLDNYEIAENTFTIKDADQPKTSLLIEEYELSANGKISLKRILPAKLLSNELFEYRKFEPKNDDPMNGY